MICSDIIIKKLYEDMLLSAHDNWANQVKLLLDSYGFTQHFLEKSFKKL